jgi:hypothetical protein
MLLRWKSFLKIIPNDCSSKSTRLETFAKGAILIKFWKWGMSLLYLQLSSRKWNKDLHWRSCSQAIWMSHMAMMTSKFTQASPSKSHSFSLENNMIPEWSSYLKFWLTKETKSKSLIIILIQSSSKDPI